MGRHSSESDEEKRKKKKKRKSRSRSRSRDHSDSGSYSSSKHSRHKKDKKTKKSKRSRSRSRGRYSRSRSRDRHRGGARRTRSRSRDRRRSRSWSKSRPRRSHSRSRSRRASSSPSRTKSRGRRSRSRSRTRKRRSRSTSADDHKIRKNKGDGDLNETVPGFGDMTPMEQTEVRMNLALKAAAAADQKLKEQGVLPLSELGTVKSFEDQHKHASAIESIENEDFVQQAFISTRGNLERNGGTKSPDISMFGTNGSASAKSSKDSIFVGPSAGDVNSFIHASLFVSKEEKLLRWKKKLLTMRRRKLEGEAMI